MGPGFPKTREYPLKKGYRGYIGFRVEGFPKLGVPLRKLPYNVGFRAYYGDTYWWLVANKGF